MKWSRLLSFGLSPSEKLLKAVIGIASFSYATMETSTSPLESAITVAVRTFWNPLRTADPTVYRFFFVQASMRSSAFSIFSIEFATLKRR